MAPPPLSPWPTMTSTAPPRPSPSPRTLTAPLRLSPSVREKLDTMCHIAHGVPGGDSYGAPQASPVGNQGYYYYYYPVREHGQAAAQESDDGLLGSLFGGGLISALLGKKFVVVVVGLAALLVAIAFGLNLSFGKKRSFDTDSLSLLSEYMTEDNLVTLVDFVGRSIHKYQ